MFDVLADFEWFRNRKGYRMVPASSLNPRWRGLGRQLGEVNWIVPNAEAVHEIKYRPFARGGDLCTPFASIRSPDELLKFVNIHGPLTWHGTEGPKLPELE